jgi:hypothetical protein
MHCDVIKDDISLTNCLKILDTYNKIQRSDVQNQYGGLLLNKRGGKHLFNNTFCVHFVWETFNWIYISDLSKFYLIHLKK